MITILQGTILIPQLMVYNYGPHIIRFYSQ